MSTRKTLICLMHGGNYRFCGRRLFMAILWLMWIFWFYKSIDSKCSCGIWDWGCHNGTQGGVGDKHVAMLRSEMVSPNSHKMDPYYCWWLKSCTTWDVWNPINNEISIILGGAGFQPSTVVINGVKKTYLNGLMNGSHWFFSLPIN